MTLYASLREVASAGFEVRTRRAMFAIIENGSRQIRVQTGDTLDIDYLDGAEPGSAISFDRVFLANGGAESVIGTPVIAGATVAAEVVEPIVKGQKLEIVKYRRRKNSRRHTGHRQKYTSVRITGINVPGLKIEEAPAKE